MTMIGVKAEGRVGDDSDFATFSYDIVNYIKLTKPTKHNSSIPTYYTPQGAFYQLRTLDDVEVALNPRGFYRYDKSTIINRNNVKRIHSTRTDKIFEFKSGDMISVSRHPKGSL